MQPKVPVPANPTLQSHPQLGANSHPLICVSPSAKFSGNIRLEGCSREWSSDQEAVATRLLRASCWYPLALALFTSQSREGESRHWEQELLGTPRAQCSSSRCHQLPQGAEQCPSCLGGGRGSQQREVVSSVCWVSLCQASPVRTRHPQFFQAPVFSGRTLGRVLAESPQTHQAT